MTTKSPACPCISGRARGISYLPQEASVFRKLTVADNLLAILETVEPDRELRQHRMEQLLEEFGITHIAGVKGYSLSGGERRRVEIARALITKPAFILLDEPFAGIDPIAVADIQNLIVSLKERNIGVLISDHNVRETLGVCDQAYILSSGEVLEYGTPDANRRQQQGPGSLPGRRFPPLMFSRITVIRGNGSMAMEMRQQLKMTQQLVMTPQLQQAIKLLQLTRLELQDVVRQELEENPLLEEVARDRGDPRDIEEQSELTETRRPPEAAADEFKEVEAGDETLR